MINMQELQIKQKDKEFSTELLKKGHEITSYEVNKMINAFFDTRTPGLPYFNPVTFKKYTTSNKKDYNNTFKTLKEDLENAYTIYNNQTDYSVIINGDYDMRMESTNKAIDSLILQTQILEEYTKKKIAYTPFIINFNDLTSVNTKNLVVNNIPYTTSEIDYNTGTLRNELQSLPNDKIDLNNASIRITCSGSKVITNSDNNKIVFDELLNSTLSITTVGGSSKPGALTISIQLEETKSISRIDMIGYSVYNTNISLYLSEDGINFFEKKTSIGDPNMIWRFNKTSVKSIKIIINKTEFDYKPDDNTGNNYCYFMISNISMYLDKYKKTSVFTSNVMELKEAISDVTLSPIQETSPKTDIAYFIGYENKNNNVEWKTIKPNTQLDLGLLYKEDKIINSNLFDGNRPNIYDKINKSFYFRHFQLPPNTNINSIEMRTGHSQWLIEPLDVTDKYPKTNGIPTDLKCHTNDYSKSRVTSIATLDSSIMDIRCEKKDNYFVMSQYAICDKDVIIENRYIEFDTNKENFDVLVLINGRQIFAKNNKYTFRLKKGENVVQLMMLLSNHIVSSLAPDGVGELPLNTVKLIRHNFNLLSYCKTLYAGPQMERINYNALIKNIDNKSLKYYSIKRENVKDESGVDNFVSTIITKFDPKQHAVKVYDPQMYDTDYSQVNNPKSRTIIFDDIVYEPNYDENNDVIKPVEGETYAQYSVYDVHMNNSEYMRTHIKYKYMLPSVKENITNNDGNSNIRLRVMAKLSTGDISVSPIINAIKIIGE